MFRKIVSNLPFSPSLAGDLAFYAKRLSAEESLRRIGFIIMALAFALQSFVVISPPQASIATSENDIVFGGSSKQDILDAWDNNSDPIGRNDIRAIYNHYGITRQNIVDATATTLHHSDGEELFSTGRFQSRGVDTWVPITGGVNGGIYERPLSTWGNVNFAAIEGTNSRGEQFWLLLEGCGNVVMETEEKEPKLEVIKRLESERVTTAGSVADYSILYRNTGSGVAEGVSVSDIVDSNFTFVSEESSGMEFIRRGDNELHWIPKTTGNTLAPSTEYKIIKLRLKLNEDVTVSQVCNRATVNGTNAEQVIFNSRDETTCVRVQTPTCPDSGLPLPANGVAGCTQTCNGEEIPYNQSCVVPEPDPITVENTSIVSCQSLDILERTAWNTYRFKTTLDIEEGASVSALEYLIDGAVIDTISIDPQATMHEYTRSFIEGSFRVDVRPVVAEGIAGNTHLCSQIVDPVEPEEILPIPVRSKAVSNITRNIDDANGSTAQGGDELSFTISISNQGDAPALNQQFIDDIHDLLEYADITDDGGGSFNAENRILSWPDVDVRPGETISKTFRARVKNPIPSTPSSASDPNISFDLKINNTFGNTIEISLPRTVTKSVEQIANVTQLPRTGPGSTMAVGFLAFGVVGYLYSRSRLLGKEARLIHVKHNAGGI